MTQEALLTPWDGAGLAGRDPRLLIVVLLLFAGSTVGLQTLAAVGGAFALATVLVAMSGMSLHRVVRRLLVLEGMMLVLVVTLPFTTAGEALVTIGPLTATREGLQTALLIVLKANAVMLAVLAMVGRLEPVVFGHALARLGVSEKLVHLLLLTVGQIELLQQELQRLRRAMKARAFVARSTRHTWASYGNLIGMLLVRSLERSRRMMAAMRCRGFHGRLHLLHTSRWHRSDTAVLVGVLPLLAGLIALDRLA